MTRVALALILVLFAWYPAAGQATATTGQIDGIITDDQGGALPGVTVASSGPSSAKATASTVSTCCRLAPTS